MRIRITCALCLMAAMLLPFAGCANNKKKLPDVRKLLEEQFFAREYYIEDVLRSDTPDGVINAMKQYGIELGKFLPKFNTRLIKFVGYERPLELEREFERAITFHMKAWQKKWRLQLFKYKKKIQEYMKYPSVKEAFKKFAEIEDTLNGFTILYHL